MRPWRRCPDRIATATGTSAGSSRRSSSASAAIFSLRARVAAMRSEVATTSASRMRGTFESATVVSGTNRKLKPTPWTRIAWVMPEAVVSSVT